MMKVEGHWQQVHENRGAERQGSSRTGTPLPFFLPRDAYHRMHKRGICCHAVSVCPSRSWIMAKRINISSKFFHHRVATPFLFFRTKRDADIPTGTPLTGALNARGYEKNYDFRPISRSI